jgi:hypothetical protein
MIQVAFVCLFIGALVGITVLIFVDWLIGKTSCRVCGNAIDFDTSSGYDISTGTTAPSLRITHQKYHKSDVKICHECSRSLKTILGAN